MRKILLFLVGYVFSICLWSCKEDDIIIPEPVDLGLSVKWAPFNVGATSPGKSGDYYAFGELKAKTKYTWNNYRFHKRGDSYDNLVFSKYNVGVDEILNDRWDGKFSLDLKDDVAHVKWGGNWRIPTLEEFKELEDNCTWVWTRMDGNFGYKITSNIPGYKNRFIFLPVVGCKSDDKLYNEYKYGYYWTNVMSPFTYYAIEYFISSDDVDNYDQDRYIGQSIRAVYQ